MALLGSTQRGVSYIICPWSWSCALLKALQLVSACPDYQQESQLNYHTPSLHMEEINSYSRKQNEHFVLSTIV